VASGCHDESLDLFDGQSFAAPAQLGGLAPSDGADLLDPTFAAGGVLESLAFVERLPTRVVVDRFDRPLVIGAGSQPAGLLVLRMTAAGASDPTFGAGGASLVPDTAAIDSRTRAPACALDALDRILLFATLLVPGDGARAVLLRLDPDGAVDAAFGDLGRVVLAPGAGAGETFAVDLALDAAGRILLCADESTPTGRHLFATRLDEDGAPDLDFGDAGRARGPEDEDSLGARVLAAPDGVVVAGTLPASPGRVALWRFDGQGLSDPGFGADGLATRSDPDPRLELAAVDAALDGAGRILLLANRSSDLAEIDDWPTLLVDFKTSAPPVFDALLCRFLAEGVPDPAFGAAGATLLAFNSGPYVSVSGGLSGGDHFDAAAGLVLDELGNAVVAGWSEPATWDTTLGWASFDLPTRPFVARLTASGALDPGFRGAGHAELGWEVGLLTSVLLPHGRPTSVARDAAGRWLLAGSSTTGSPQRLWRLTP